jgi:mannose/fructose/N-acetylgalactosamine-specific phosphotransferase system component IIC
MSYAVLGLSRLMHISAACFVIGNSFSDVIWGKRTDSVGYLVGYLVCYLFILVSGIVTLAVSRPSKQLKQEDYKLWLLMIYTKFVIWILFIPIPDWIAQSVGGTFPRTEFNAGLIFGILIISIASKQYREYYQVSKDQLLND